MVVEAGRATHALTALAVVAVARVVSKRSKAQSFMANMDDVLAQHEDFKAELLDGEVVLYHDAQKKMIYLNESASAVWQLCDGQRGVGEIVTLLTEAYPDAASFIASDVNDAIDNLVEEGALYVVGMPPKLN